MRVETHNLEETIALMAVNIIAEVNANNRLEELASGLSIEENIYEDLEPTEIDCVAHKIKEALITIAAIKALGLNKKCVNYLLSR